MASFISAPKRRDSPSQIPSFREQPAKVERAVGIATLVGAPVRSKGRGDIPSLLQQHAQIEACSGVDEIIRSGSR
jgi:hypothetical protein